MNVEGADPLAVTLIVKAPNQQVADQTVQVESSWTIAKLKGHLSEVYPCKPKYEEQKLIYSGRLLSDNIVLKDVLRKYEGQDTHTVHLVCTPPHVKYQRSPPPKPTPPPAQQPRPETTSTNTTTNNDGLRQRNVPQPTPSAPPPVSNNNVPQPNMYGFHPHYMNQDQLAAWSSHYNQWISAAYNTNPQGTVNYPTFASAPMPPTIDPMMYAAQMAWMHQMQQYLNMSGFPQPGGFTMNQQVVNPNPDQSANNQNVQENEQPVRQELVNPNLDNGDDENNHQDWLDWFYNFSRWLLMFSILYFYSNPIRFFTVLILGTTIYFFHEARNERRRNIIIDNINNNYQPQANNNDQAVRPEGENANDEESEGGNRTPNNEGDNEDSFLSITWTAFTSFFSSLIPEVPNARN